VCQENPDAVLELSADGELIALTPTGSETGARNSALAVALALAVRSSGLPFKQFDSSTGFRLPNGSVLSPDATLIRLERWNALTPEQRRGFAPLFSSAGCCCPRIRPWRSGRDERVDPKELVHFRTKLGGPG
jgi:Uma2 family endonuclease